MRGTNAGPPLRVLFLTCHLPYPPASGGRRREYELLRRLGGKVDFDLVAVSKTLVEDRSNAHRLAPMCHSVQVVPASSDGNLRGAQQVRRHACPSLVDTVAELAAAVDLVHVEGFYLMQHVPADCPVPIVLIEQNVEYDLCKQRASVARALPEVFDRMRDYRQTRIAEIEAWRRSDLVGVLTEDDRRAVLSVAPDVRVRLTPDGVGHPSAWADADGTVPDLGGPLLVFVANFAYEPNLDAARYLCSDVLPRIAREVRGVRLALVGTSPPDELRRLAGERDDVIVTGRVPAVEPYLDQADVVVAPLRVGGGVKVKVLEALSRGKAIVATSVAAQGFGADARSSMHNADEPESFAAAAVHLLQSPAERARLEAAALRLAARLPSWDDAAQALHGCYREVTEVAVRPVSESTSVVG